MDISYEVSSEDLELAKRRNPSVAQGGRALRIVLLFVILILGWFALRNGLLVIYLVGLAVLLFSRFLLRVKSEAGSDSTRGPGLRSLALDEGGLREQAGDAQRYVAWREVRAITTAHEHTFVLPDGRRQPLVIPKGRIHGGDYDTFVRAMYEAYARHKMVGGR